MPDRRFWEPAPRLLCDEYETGQFVVSAVGGLFGLRASKGELKHLATVRALQDPARCRTSSPLSKPKKHTP
jgi:hypothetical protein